jgi:hypothetical protein
MNSSTVHRSMRLLSVVMKACPLFLISTISFAAFGPYPFQAQVDVTPWVPKPSEHVVLGIDDTLSGNTFDGSGFADLQIVRDGSVFNLMATLAYGAPQGMGLGHAHFDVDLGALPEGKYTVNYASNGSNFVGFSLHNKTLTFTVASIYPRAIEYFDRDLHTISIPAIPTRLRA